jgi:N-acetylglutamate synthase-like GNAT family acetyltransferase
MLQFKFIDQDGPEYEKEKMLRWEALGKPLGLPPESELVSQDKECMHLIAIEKKKIIGCVCFFPSNADEGEIFQMAVSEEYRGKGFGRKLIHALEKALSEKGIKQLFLYAWEETEGFYKKMGYRPEGEQVKRNGVNCRLMKKKLEADGS